MLISSLPGANTRLPEHKIGVFVRFRPPKPPFSGFLSTKSGFLCFFGLRDPCFRAFRAQNQVFCALLGSGTLVYGHFEHKIGFFVRFWGLEPSFSGISSTKSRFLCSFTNGCWVGALSRRQRHRRTCGAVAPAQPSYLRSQCASYRCLSPPTAGAAVATAAAPAQPLCHLPSPVAAYRRCSLSHLRSRYYRSLPPLHLTARAG